MVATTILSHFYLFFNVFNLCDFSLLVHFDSRNYDNDIDKVREILLDITNNSELVLKDKDVLVKVKSHGDNSIVMLYRMWVKTDDYWELKFYILEVDADTNTNNYSYLYLL